MYGNKAWTFLSLILFFSWRLQNIKAKISEWDVVATGTKKDQTDWLNTYKGLGMQLSFVHIYISLGGQLWTY